MKNVCIVGYGAIGPVHARALEHVRKARLYAVCNTDEKRCRCGLKQHVNRKGSCHAKAHWIFRAILL